MTEAFSLAGKLALITGGTSGLGFAIARAFAACGAAIIVCSRKQKNVDDAVQALRVEYPSASINGTACDVSIEKNISDMFSALPAQLDILVCAAGIINRTPSMDESLEMFDRVIKTNLYGTFACCQHAGRMMRDSKAKDPSFSGVILNVASLTAHVALADVAAYACSKAAIAQLTRNLASDWAVHGIRVNALSPGVFPTDINKAAITGTPRGDWMLKQTPMARFGEAHELAWAAVYLVSGASSFTTGTVLPVDGGFLARGVGPNPVGTPAPSPS